MSKNKYHKSHQTLDNGQDTPRPSRSAQKRRSLALQHMGMALLQLAPEDLLRLNLPTELRDAVRQYPHTRGHEAKRRQMQYIGRLMRELEESTLLKLAQNKHIAASLDGKMPSV